ncbi:hypothetical protein PFISCL1PPCAC_25704, partial [Pristionchus fissidentatus]
SEMVSFLTPLPSDNRANLNVSITSQNFKKVTEMVEGSAAAKNEDNFSFSSFSWKKIKKRLTSLICGNDASKVQHPKRPASKATKRDGGSSILSNLSAKDNGVLVINVKDPDQVLMTGASSFLSNLSAKDNGVLVINVKDPDQFVL